MRKISVLIKNEKLLIDYVQGYKDMNPTGHTSVEECRELIRESCNKHLDLYGFSCPDTDLFIDVMAGWDKCHWFEPVELEDTTGKRSNYLYTVEYKGTFKG